MKQNILIVAILLTGLLFPPHINVQAQSNRPVVHAVLFYSPTCGHCALVINGTILPMARQYGDQLQIIGVDVSQQQGWNLFLAALEKFGIKNGGVPFLVIDNRYLMGSADIPEQFPNLVAAYLVQGGVDWPDIPGLRLILPAPTAARTMTETSLAAATTASPLPASASPAPTSTSLATKTPLAAAVPVSSPPTFSPAAATPTLNFTHQNDLTWRERFARDPAGNMLAVFVLLGMLGAAAWAIRLFQTMTGTSLKERWSWIIPILSVTGAGVAGYLAYVETAEVTAVCGPVGDCNTVQQSEYARLFGILPIGILGLIGYAGILLAWLVARFTHGRLADLATLTLLGMSVFGVLFSIYLTFLEPFVIGATCAWCLTSAIVMTALMLLLVSPAKLVLS